MRFCDVGAAVVPLMLQVAFSNCFVSVAPIVVPSQSKKKLVSCLSGKAATAGDIFGLSGATGLFKTLPA